MPPRAKPTKVSSATAASEGEKTHRTVELLDRVYEYFLCYESCPSLRDMQAASFTAHPRQISEVFSPRIKALAPPDAFQKSVAMNAALALNWARLSGSRLCLPPYESTGHVDARRGFRDRRQRTLFLDARSLGTLREPLLPKLLSGELATLTDVE